MRSAILAAVAALLAACQSSDVSREVGARCDRSSECDDRCLPATDYPGGFCTTACATRDDCPSGAVCAEVDGGVCLFSCTTDASCGFLGAGWRCTASDLHGGGIQGMVCRGA